MKQTKYENGAVMLENKVVLEDEEIDIYEELCKEIEKLVKNVDGLGKKELPNGTEEDVRKKGLEILKANYSTAYNKLVRKIGNLANEYIRIYCFGLLFYKDAADMMLVDPIQVITGYIKDKTPDVKKAIFTDYSVDEFTQIVNGIRENVTALALVNWTKHQEIVKKNRG